MVGRPNSSRAIPTALRLTEAPLPALDPERVSQQACVLALDVGSTMAKAVLAEKDEKKLPRLARYYAESALAIDKYPDTVNVKLQAIRIGDVGIVSIPCEVFAEIGQELKRRSPLRPTFTIDLANGYNGYLPPLPGSMSGLYGRYPYSTAPAYPGYSGYYSLPYDMPEAEPVPVAPESRTYYE